MACIEMSAKNDRLEFGIRTVEEHSKQEERPQDLGLVLSKASG